MFLYRKTCNDEANQIRTGHFNEVSWWTDDIDRVNEYVGDVIVKILIIINDQLEVPYLMGNRKLGIYTTSRGIDIDPSIYKGFGRRKQICGATYFSLSGDYIRSNLISMDFNIIC